MLLQEAVARHHERQLAETQALLYAQASGQLGGGFGGGGFGPPGDAFGGFGGGGKLDASGAILLPGGDPSPRATGHGRKTPGGMSVGSNNGAAPPHRSQSDRREWLLQEKRRWLVEMRLGGPGNAAETPTSIQAPTPSKLPPIMSNGTDLATLATPR